MLTRPLHTDYFQGSRKAILGCRFSPVAAALVTLGPRVSLPMTCALQRVSCLAGAGWLVPCLVLVGLSIGCGESDPLGRHAVSGTVTLDGAPLENGNIGFQPADKSTTSGGDVIAGGKYSIARDKGLPVGKYKVTINAPKPGTGGTAPAMPGDPVPVPEELIPKEWNVNSQEFIEVTDKGQNVFNFDVKSKGKS